MAGLEFDRPIAARRWALPAVDLARSLLGQVLAVRTEGEVRAVRIVETEAYANRDPANHTYRGMTFRNLAMFGPPGSLYVYRIHQVHCANVVGRAGEAALLRAGEPLTPGLSSTAGPGRLCTALGIDRRFNGADLARSEVRILHGDSPHHRILRAPRVGISQGQRRLYRFAIDRSRWVSRPRPPGWRAA